MQPWRQFGLLKLSAMESKPSFTSLLRSPDLVRAFGLHNAEIRLAQVGDLWEGAGAEIHVDVHPTHVARSHFVAPVTFAAFNFDGGAICAISSCTWATIGSGRTPT